jgi:ubiquinol-cytochrome c reductase cytochrome b subunit
VPFIDRGPVLRLGKRVFAISFAALALLGWGGLTTAAILTTPRNPASRVLAEGQLLDWQRLSPAELAGLTYFRAENCLACHPGSGKKGVGPDLTQMPLPHRNPAWLVRHFKAPAEVVPGSPMPPVRLRDSELNELALFVLRLTPQTEAELKSAPEFAVRAAALYQDSHCNACHQLRGSGMKIGPPLDGVGERHGRAWLEEHFNDPASISKGSKMAAYHFNAEQMNDICEYLLQMP